MYTFTEIIAKYDYVYQNFENTFTKAQALEV